ncbi:hypothetical protein [Corynebacterium nasicanis]|uniref:Uncharacterized protein n=1 Tax=Corynebacterium nasicanis TaxID=1448267 RepID=A0ABW1QBT1_9CORY
MAQKYELNYDWSRLGPIKWTEYSEVTLQVDVDSRAAAPALHRYWAELPREGDLGYAGGCRFPEPVRMSGEHSTGWIVSRGEDAFDSIAHYAEELRQTLEAADPDVVITWTELPFTS